jgi:hypothetical protein
MNRSVTGVGALKTLVRRVLGSNSKQNIVQTYGDCKAEQSFMKERKQRSFNVFIFLVVLGLNLRVSYLLGRYSTT